jgi:ATP-binding cassette subfamily B (MDR/TAP) protein 1
MQGLAALGVALYYSWDLTLIVMCTIPLLYLVQTFIAKRLSVRSHEQAEKVQSALKYITTAIQSIETVKCFNGERYELQNFTKIVGVAAGLYRRIANVRSIQIGLMQFFTLSVFVQGFWYGIHLVDTGKTDAGKVLTTFWAALMAITGITMVLPQFIVLQKGKMAAAKLSIIMQQVSTSDQLLELQGQTKPARCPGDIEFRKVSQSIRIHTVSNSLGYILVSFSTRRDCYPQRFVVHSRRRNHVCYRQEWFRKKHIGSTTGPVLPTFVWTNIPGWCAA